MFKISKIARHTVVQATACAKIKTWGTCPDILVKKA